MLMSFVLAAADRRGRVLVLIVILLYDSHDGPAPHY